MRYLKVVVKDQSANAEADTVKLYFFQRNSPLPDELVRQATAVDVSADGLVDYQMAGDLDGNGISSQEDRALLQSFANDVLRLGWLSRPTMPTRSINFYVSRFDTATNPAEVRLDFYQSETPMRARAKLIFSLTADDVNGSGILQLDLEALPPDLFNGVDREVLQRMVDLYLKLNWS